MAERQPPAPLLSQFLQSFSLRPVLLRRTFTVSGLCLVPGWLFKAGWLVRILNDTLELGAGVIAASFVAPVYPTRRELPAIDLGGEALRMSLGYAARGLLFQVFGHRNGMPMPSPTQPLAGMCLLVASAGTLGLTQGPAAQVRPPLVGRHVSGHARLASPPRDSTSLKLLDARRNPSR